MKTITIRKWYDDSIIITSKQPKPYAAYISKVSHPATNIRKSIQLYQSHKQK